MMDAMPQGDVKPRLFCEQAVFPRVATPDDLDFVMAMGMKFYGSRLDTQEKINGAARWVRQVIVDPDRLVLVHPGSVGIANVNWRYGMEGRGAADILCCDPERAGPWTALKMARMMVEWARAKGATGPFKLSADTGVDFGPFAVRLGGRLSPDKIYEIPL